MAATFGLTEGDTATLTTAAGEVEAEVAGVVSSAEYLWPAPDRQNIIVPPKSFGVVFASEADALAWSGAPENQALVLLTEEGRADPAVLEDLRTAAVAAGAVEVLDREQQPSNALLQEDISGFEQMAVAFPALFLSAAALVLYVLLTRRVAEERQVHRYPAGRRHARAHHRVALHVLRPARGRGRRPARPADRDGHGRRDVAHVRRHHRAARAADHLRRLRRPDPRGGAHVRGARHRPRRPGPSAPGCPDAARRSDARGGPHRSCGPHMVRTAGSGDGQRSRPGGG